MITALEQSDLDFLYKLQDPNRQDRVPSSLLTPIFVSSEYQFNTGTYYIKQQGKYYPATQWDPAQEYYRDPIYNIDLNSRTIEAPKFLSVRHDHHAETIYFAVDRYFDNVDLSNVFCVVQYQNANPNVAEGGFFYAVPYLDTTTLVTENKILFPWVIEGAATAFSGKITFAIKFYEIDTETVDQMGGTVVYNKFYKYLLNTLPATSTILHGLDVQATSENYHFPSTEIDKIYQMIETVNRTNDLYWITFKDDGTLYDPSSDYPESTINKNDTITDLITE